MLSFNDLLDEKLSDPSFKSFFDRECHICPTTVNLVARLEADARERERVLNRLGITETAYADLKKGDFCDPETVFALYREMGIEIPEKAKQCPRMK